VLGGIATIVDRFAAAMPVIDQSAPAPRTRGRLPSAFNMSEPQCVQSFAHWWSAEHPGEVPGFRQEHLERPYPTDRRRRCDLVVERAGGAPGSEFEWALEVKKIAIVGDNGKNNDFGLQKLLSPYLKDRSLLHDAIRVSASGLARNYAILVLAFDFGGDAVERAFDLCRRIGLDMERAENLAAVVRTVDPAGREYRLDPAIQIADYVLRVRGLVAEPFKMARFAGLERHPCGTEGLVCGWQLLRSTGSP